MSGAAARTRRATTPATTCWWRCWCLGTVRAGASHVRGCGVCASGRGRPGLWGRAHPYWAAHCTAVSACVLVTRPSGLCAPPASSSRTRARAHICALHASRAAHGAQATTTTTTASRSPLRTAWSGGRWMRRTTSSSERFRVRTWFNKSCLLHPPPDVCVASSLPRSSKQQGASRQWGWPGT
jgi:hypothetical protein